MSGDGSVSHDDSLKCAGWVAFFGIAFGIGMNAWACLAAYVPIIQLPPGTEARPLGLALIWMFYCLLTLGIEIIFALLCIGCGWRNVWVWCLGLVCLGLGVAPFYLMPMISHLAAQQADITYTF